MTVIHASFGDYIAASLIPRVDIPQLHDVDASVTCDFGQCLYVVHANCNSLCAGLSFKKGLVKLNASTEMDMLQYFTLPPCNVNVALKQLTKDRYFLTDLAFL